MTAVSRFFASCEQNQIGQLADIEPLHVAAYIEALGQDFEKPTVKQHVAGIRMLFDWLVTGQVVAPTRRMRCVARRPCVVRRLWIASFLLRAGEPAVIHAAAWRFEAPL
jgi:site-specific recombinase XerD